MPFLAALLARRRRRRRFLRPSCPSSRIVLSREKKATPHLLARTSDSPTTRRSPTSESGTAAERLTDDLLLEILSRLPAKSVCRFKCVCNHWLSLIDHPIHRKKLPQTLAGFFYTSNATVDWALGIESFIHFTTVSGRRRDISFGFLSNHPPFHLLHCCNGLLFGCSQRDEFRYVVLNPATEQWVAFPRCSKFISPVLAFDPDLSSHFHVFDWVYEDDDQDEQDEPDLAGVVVYSSETGGWVYKEKTWSKHIRLTEHPTTVFLNGYLHFLADDRDYTDCLAVVDTKGETWMHFPVPGGLNEGFIQQSQGRLNYVYFERDDDVALRLVIYVLESYQSKEWILTHSVKTSCLFGGEDVLLDVDSYWIVIHPDCNLVFFTARADDNTLMCYNMDRRQVKEICNLERRNRLYLPYVPFYSELQSLHS